MDMKHEESLSIITLIVRTCRVPSRPGGSGRGMRRGERNRPGLV